MTERKTCKVEAAYQKDYMQLLYHPPRIPLNWTRIDQLPLICAPKSSLSLLFQSDYLVLVSPSELPILKMCIEEDHRALRNQFRPMLLHLAIQNFLALLAESFFLVAPSM